MTRWLLPLLLLGCSSSTDGDGFKCAIGDLTGTWRVTYAETNGSCGRINDETVVFTPSKAGAGAAACTTAAADVAADKCSVQQDFTCPLSGVAGTQHWVGVVRQTGEGTLGGSLTLSVTGSLACRSTYDVRFTKQ